MSTRSSSSRTTTMNKPIYTILGALAIVAMLLGFVTTSTAVAQTAPDLTPWGYQIDSNVITVKTGNSGYPNAYVFTATNQEMQELFLVPFDPEIAEPWSHKVLVANATKVIVTYEGDTPIIEVDNTDGKTRWTIIDHEAEDVQAGYPIRFTPWEDPDDGDTFEYRDFENGTVIHEEVMSCEGINLGLALVEFTDGYHLVVYREDNVVSWDNRMVTEPAYKFALDGCDIELKLVDGRTLAYYAESWPTSTDPNAKWRLDGGTEVTYTVYAPFRVTLTLTIKGRVQTLTCELQRNSDAIVITCPTGAAGH